MKVNEPNMFNDEDAFGGKVFSWEGTSEWFYVEKRDGKKQVIYADEKGRYYYGERDLSHVVPVVWNNRSSAARVARRMSGKVKKFPYTIR